MKRNLRKTKEKVQAKKDDTRRSSALDESLDNSIDEIFRFDDKLIGKRTNAIFEPKPTDDGFFQIELKSNIHSDFSINASESFDIYNIDEFSDIDEKKNEKMVRMVTNIEIEASQMTVNDLSEIEKLIEEDEGEASQSGPKNKTNNPNSPGNATNVPKVQKSPDSRQIPTIEKKNIPPSDQENPPSVDQEKSTKSRPNSKKKEGQQILQKKKENRKINPQERKKSKGVANGQKMSQINAITKEIQRQTTYQRLKRQQQPSANIFQKFVQNEKNRSKNKLKEKSLQKQSKITENQSVNQSNTRKTGANYERKRPPRMSQSRNSQQEESPRLKKIEIEININTPVKELNYQPLGKIRDTRYPRRFRIPPLRGWQNQRRNYEHGRLSSITLIDDGYGRQIEKTIRYQKERIID